MKRSTIFILATILLLGIEGFVPTMLFAATPDVADMDVVWTKNPNRRTGLFTTKSHAIGKDIQLTLDGLYYYGDMETVGFSLQSPDLKNAGASFTVDYLHSIHSVLKMRYSIGGSYLRGTKRGIINETQRNFTAFSAKAAAGLEWYPIRKYGFYVYAGVLLQYNCVDYYIYADQGREHTFLPMIPVELGYKFQLGKSWRLGVHLGIAQGLLDKDHFNLDAWPQKDKYGNSNDNKWLDGYMFLGLSISYSWHNCESCRLAW